jgi:hypothetical protein
MLSKMMVWSGVEDASLHTSWRDKAEIPPKKKDDRQADRLYGKSGTQKCTTTEILRNPNLSIKTPKKSTDEQTSRQQI